MKPCRNLRWKGARDDRLAQRDLEAIFLRNEVPYTCLQTCQSFGPDGDLVAPERCGAGRRCHEDDPIV